MKLYVRTTKVPGGPDDEAVFVELEDENGASHGPDVGVEWSEDDHGALLGPFLPAALFAREPAPEGPTADELVDEATSALEEIDLSIVAARDRLETVTLEDSDRIGLELRLAQALTAREELRVRQVAALPRPAATAPDVEDFLSETWRAVDKVTGSTATADQVVGALRSKLGAAR